MKVVCSILLLILSTCCISFANDSTQVVPKAYVIHDDDTLYSIFSSIGPYSPKERSDIIEKRLNALVEDQDFRADSIYVHLGETTADIMFRDMIILSVTKGDAEPVGKSLMALATEVEKSIKTTLSAERKSQGILNALVQIGLTILELLILFLIIRYLNRLFNWTKRWLIGARQKILKGIKFKGYELLDTNRELQAALFLNNIVRWVVIIIVLYLAIPILFSIFPWTRGLSDKLFGYVFTPLKNILFSIINYIPNLFTIGVIYLVTRYAIKAIKFIATEIQSGALEVSGFYPDWAIPTFNIVKVLLYAFMFIVIFPYLPGSESPVFQGVSVFLGILFSLGSSSAISNAVAGLVITYMRPFKVGDRIRIGEITGDVVEKSFLVTRIRTIKNEVITIPNSSILSGHSVNYTTSADEKGLIIHTGVTIGYEVPWKKVHELLINAALATHGILNEEDKKPFVLQTSLDDFYVSYQINAFTRQANRLSLIYSELHQNIQDQFATANVEILSPHYKSERDGNPSTVPSSSSNP